MDGKERWRRRRGRQRRRQQGRPCPGRRLSSGAALGELFGLLQASGLWLQALDHRGQCEAGLFGDVFSAGPICLFSVLLAVDTSVVEKKEEVRVWLALTNGPWAAELVGSFRGACGHWSWTFDVPGRGLYVGAQCQVACPGPEMVGPELFILAFPHPGITPRGLGSLPV